MKKETLRWIAAVFAVAVLSPGVVHAAGGQLVTLTDPSTSAAARVETASLRVVEVAPSDQWSTYGTLSGSTPVTVVSSTVWRPHLTNLTFTATGTTAPVRVRLTRWLYTNDQPVCGSTPLVVATMQEYVVLPAQGMVPITYTPPLSRSQGRQCWRLAQVSPPSGARVSFTGAGFHTVS